jgi:hypothetical protein
MVVHGRVTLSRPLAWRASTETRERIGIYRKVRLRRFINPDKRLLQAPEVAAQRAWRERRKRARETETLAGTDIAT